MKRAGVSAGHLLVFGEGLQDVAGVARPQAVEQFRVGAVRAAAEQEADADGRRLRMPAQRPRTEQRARHDDGPLEQACDSP